MSPAGHVFRKEVREMMRDKRVLSSAFIGPVFMIVMFLVLFGFLQDTLKKPSARSLHVVDTPDARKITDQPGFEKAFKVHYVASEKEGERLLKEGKAKAVLSVPGNFEEELKAQKPVKFKVTFDPDDQLSPIIVGTLSQTISATSKKALESIFEKLELNKALAEPITLEEKKIEKPKGLGSSMIVGLLPYLIVIWAFYGGFSIVTDLVAGEKEKNTLETLLISPVSRVQIALGKFGALCLVCLTSSLSSLFGVLVVGLLNVPMTRGMFPEGVQIGFMSILAILGALIPLVALFAAVLLAISAYARNSREAQTHLTLVSFVVIMPAVFSQVIGFTGFAKETWVSLVPVLNAAGVIREALLGNVNLAALGLTVLSSLVLAAIAMRVTIRLFQREEVLSRI